MTRDKRFDFGVLYLVHLVISADGVVDQGELRALEAIIEQEGMDSNIYRDFIKETSKMNEREIFNKGIQMISECSPEQQRRAFGWLMKISESDGQVHAKEIRFLLYSVKKAGIDFNDVVTEANNLPDLP